MDLYDTPIVAAWNIQLHLDEGSTPLTLEIAEKRYREWLSTGKYSGLVFSFNGEACGYILFEFRAAGNDIRSPSSIYVRQFFIDEKFRRNGIGSHAFKIFQNTSVPTGTIINLEANISNPAGQRFWESLGFKACEIAYELK